MQEILASYRSAAETELADILQFWMEHAPDEINGGFVGRVNSSNWKDYTAPKGSVLNSRILWSFSAAFNATKRISYLLVAGKAYDYFIRFFTDPEWGGVYWTVQPEGEPLDTKKQVYAQAFAVYGLSEYAIASGDEAAKQQAIRIYHLLIEYTYDPVHGGYAEALSRNWQPMSDIRLSEKDANDPKSMNTHLHVLEAFANLYRIWPDPDLQKKLAELVELFLYKIISPATHHLSLFFKNDWTPTANLISYGHDIEAAWLVPEASSVLGNKDLLAAADLASLKIASAAAEGLDGDGGLWYERDAGTQHLIRQKHWWPQAEAMVGFFYAWQLSNQEEWLQRSWASWQFVKKSLKDPASEWRWGVLEDGRNMPGEDKIGIWKCPYHNSRACMEIMRRIGGM